jgi:hypothetical protein
VIRFALAAIAVAGCAAAPPPVASICGPTASRALLPGVAWDGCRIGYREANEFVYQNSRPPDGGPRERAWWEAGYARGWAHARLRADVEHGKNLRRAGTAFFVVSAIGGTIAIVTAALLGVADTGFCLDCFVLLIAAPVAAIHFGVGIGLTVGGAVEQGASERALRELDLPGPIPVRPRAPNLGWSFRF